MDEINIDIQDPIENSKKLKNEQLSENLYGISLDSKHAWMVLSAVIIIQTVTDVGKYSVNALNKNIISNDTSQWYGRIPILAG